jgi:hypothetical protein
MKTLFRKIRTMLSNLFSSAFFKAINVLPNNGLVTLCDVGAAGDIEPRWRAISSFLKYVGFEPDKRSRDKLMRNPADCYSYNIVGNALWEAEKQLDLNLCVRPEVSSVYSPNVEFLKNFPETERFDILYTESLPVGQWMN